MKNTIKLPVRIDFGGVILRLLSVIVRGVVRLIGGVLDGLSAFDI